MFGKLRSFVTGKNRNPNQRTSRRSRESKPAAGGDSIKKSLVKGNNVYLRGFGSFIVKKRAQKTGRNISKNTTIIIPEHFIPAFKPAKVFVEKVKSSLKG